ncbi:MAG: NAD-dependent epimerase/dehydratase family protein [Chloroflexota bacterium]
MKALVTGGAGFIGSHLVDLLLCEGHAVAVVDNLVTGRRDNLNPRADFYELDIASPDLPALITAVRPEVVFHQAAQMSVKVSTDDPAYDARVNVLGLINLLDACAANGVRKVVYASSGATYGNPQYLPMDEDHPQRPEAPYGITKMAGEYYLTYYALDHGLAFTALRYGNVYGPRQDSHGEAGVVAIFVRVLLSGGTPVIHWDGDQTRDYVYVTDVARANLLAASLGDGRAYCIGTGVGTSVNRLYSALCETMGVSVAPEHGPRRPGDLRAAYFDCSRARAELGWAPTVSLAEGLLHTVEALRGELAPQNHGAGAK